MATATATKRVVETVEGVTVNLSHEEALALAALAGYIGGSPEAGKPRRLACDALEEIGIAIGLRGVFPHSQALEGLGASLTGSVTFGKGV